jgi:hypothetical protein
VEVASPVRPLFVLFRSRDVPDDPAILAAGALVAALVPALRTARGFDEGASDGMAK